MAVELLGREAARRWGQSCTLRAKALFAGDAEAAAKIACAESSAAAKALGRRGVRGLDVAKRNDARDGCMLAVLRATFEDPALRA